jgi:hypothetical protein
MKRTLIVLAILASAAVDAQAAILSDDFTYPDGPILSAPDSSWIANTGSGSMNVTNNTLIVTSLQAQDIAHWLDGGPYYTNGAVAALYSKFTLKCTFLPNLAGTYFAHFTGTNAFQNGPPNLSGFRARLWATMTNYPGTGGATPNPALGQFNLGIANSGTGASGSTGNTNWMWATPLDTNHTYLIVSKYVLATGVSTFWVDPSTASEPAGGVSDPTVLPLEPTDVAPTNGIINIDWYSFRQASGEGTLLIDNLKVGTSWDDLFNSPTIAPTPVTQYIPMNGSTPELAFTISTPISGHQISDLQLVSASSNPTLVPNDSSHITFTKNNTTGDCTVKVTGATGQQGSATITVTVQDNASSPAPSSAMSFKVVVGAPTISAIPNQITGIGAPTPAIAFAVADAEGDAITLTKASSNPTLVPTANIQIGVAVPNVSSNVVVTPAAAQTGVSFITISASDTHNTNSTTFAVTVSPSLGVVFSEPFNYPDGSLYGASGSPWSHASPTGSGFGELQVTNGQAQLSRSQAEDVAASLTGGPFASSSGVVLYTGFQVSFTELPSNLGNYFLHLKDTDTGSTFRAKVFANTANAATGLFRLGVSCAANSPSPQFPRDLMLNQPYIVVTRYNSGTGDTRFWINPTSTNSPSVDATDLLQTATLGWIGLREDTGIGTNYIDNIVISTSFADVVPAITRPTLSINRDSLGNVVLTWPNPLFALQSASVVTGPYADVQNASSPYTNAPSGQKFFRLNY